MDWITKRPEAHLALSIALDLVNASMYPIPKFVLFNPLNFLASASLNAGSIGTVCCSVAFWLVLRRRICLAGLFLAIAGYICPYNLVFLIPLHWLGRLDGEDAFYFGHQSRMPLFTLFWWVQLARLSLGFPHSLSHFCTCHWTFASGQPGIGALWYPHVQVFGEYRGWLSGALHFVLMVHLIPAGFRFGTSLPGMPLFVTATLLALLKPLPVYADYGLALNCIQWIGCNPKDPLRFNRIDTQSAPTHPPPFLLIIALGLGCAGLFAAFLPHIFWTYWMVRGVDAANFYFACGLAWNVLLGMLLLYLVRYGRRLEIN